MIILVSIVCVLLLLYYLATANYNYWKTKGVPFEKPFLLFGSFYDVVVGKHGMFEKIREIYSKYKGPYVGIYIFNQPHLIIRNPELVKKILVKDFDKFVNRNFSPDESVDPIAYHSLGSAKDKVWKNLRNKLSPVFTSGKIKLMFPLMRNCAQDLSSYLSKYDGETVETRNIFKRYTVDIISSCAFGIDAYCLKSEHSEILKMATQLSDPKSFVRNLSFFALFFIPSLASIFRLTLTEKFASKYFIDVFKVTLKEREEKKIVRNDLIDSLNNLKKVENQTDNYTFDDIKMAAQAIVFFSAGNDTTASALSFVLYELALNTKIQDRLREEIKEIMDQDGNFSYEAINEIKYLEMILNETLRKYPLAAFLNRKSGSSYTFEETGFTLEKDVNIMIPVTGFHYDPEYFPDPEKFDPERFNDQNKQSIKPYTYLPFGDGPRVCIGERFAKLVTKVAIVYAIKDFVFEVTNDTTVPIRLNPRTFFTQSDDVKLRIKKIRS